MGNDGYGITKKCAYSNCSTYFHSLCGKKEDYVSLICKTKSKQIFIQFCNKHKNVNINNCIEQMLETKQSTIGPIALNDNKMQQTMTLDQKLHRPDIGLNTKEVIKLLWDRTDKYFENVTTSDYLRIAPHNFHNDPIFSTPILGKCALSLNENTNLIKKKIEKNK